MLLGWLKVWIIREGLSQYASLGFLLAWRACSTSRVFPTLDRDKVRILLLSNDGGWIILMRMVSKQHAGIIQILTTPDLVAANVTGGQKCTDPSVLDISETSQGHPRRAAQGSSKSSTCLLGSDVGLPLHHMGIKKDNAGSCEDTRGTQNGRIARDPISNKFAELSATQPRSSQKMCCGRNNSDVGQTDRHLVLQGWMTFLLC